MGNQSPPGARVRKDLGLPERYEALRHVASGGMASVWCARDQALGRNVAVKLLAERLAGDDEAHERFLREARAAARLSGHPNVVMIYDVGETASDGRAFIVMEYLAGGTVADALRVDSVRRVHAVKWVREAASALDFAHSRGVLHRDIKPANLLLDRDRVLHVADFGIARLGTEDTITGTGQVLGTASYLAPERALGEPATNASDRYSLAVVAFELLVGERPFTSTHFAAQARQHVDEEPPAASVRNRALPPAVDPVLARGMAKRPEDRWPTAQDFAQALDSALTEATTRSHPRVVAAAAARPPRPSPSTATRRAAPRTASHPPATGRGPRRRRARIPALAALIAGAAAAVAIAGTLGHSGTSAGSSSTAQRQASAATHNRTTPRKPAAKRKTTEQTVTATAAAATTPPPTADTLEARGHQLMLDGDYARRDTGSPPGHPGGQPHEPVLRLRAVRPRPLAAAGRRSARRGHGALPAPADPQPDARGPPAAAARADRARTGRERRRRPRPDRPADRPAIATTTAVLGTTVPAADRALVDPQAPRVGPGRATTRATSYARSADFSAIARVFRQASSSLTASDASAASAA